MPFYLIAGGISALIGVALGAFGAHGLQGKVEERFIEVWETGVEYQMYHAIALLAVGILMNSSLFGGSPLLKWAGNLFIIGTIFFSGSLYVTTLAGGGLGKFGLITPVGGVLFLAGWVCFIIAMIRG
ncbi:MAG TPA: DUF423 domain-containing protein [Savagea sp.]